MEWPECVWKCGTARVHFSVALCVLLWPWKEVSATNCDYSIFGFCQDFCIFHLPCGLNCEFGRSGVLCGSRRREFHSNGEQTCEFSQPPPDVSDILRRDAVHGGFCCQVSALRYLAIGRVIPLQLALSRVIIPRTGRTVPARGHPDGIRRKTTLHSGAIFCNLLPRKNRNFIERAAAGKWCVG